jgi:hypothetical protein
MAEKKYRIELSEEQSKESRVKLDGWAEAHLAVASC